jgi:hypothetical protein
MPLAGGIPGHVTGGYLPPLTRRFGVFLSVLIRTLLNTLILLIYFVNEKLTRLQLQKDAVADEGWSCGHLPVTKPGCKVAEIHWRAGKSLNTSCSAGWEGILGV